MVDVTSEWPDYAVYTEKLKRLRESAMERGRKVFDVDSNHFNTFVHGDLWTNNIMTKYSKIDESVVENFIFFDFQYSCWGSPAIDLNYIFYTSMQDSLRTKHFDELIEFYHGHLVSSLRAAQYKKNIPSLEEFWTQFNSKRFFSKYMIADNLLPN